MNIRSRARAEREVRRSIEKKRRIERRQKLESRESFGTSYNLRSTMGRRGVNSSRGTSRGSKADKMFDVSAVAPIVLFPVSEEDNQVDKGGSEVMFMCNILEIIVYATSHVVWPMLMNVKPMSECELKVVWALGTGSDADTTSFWGSL